MPTLKPGQIIDRYQIIAFLANGGMGEVYHARHQFMDSDVALKLVFPHLMADPAIAERFQREVRSIAKLRHEHIIKVFDAGLSDGHHFMAMEYLGAGSLAKELQIARETGQKIPIQRAIEITRQIALALDYAHRAGFAHRDVKPGNVLKRSADDYVLTDFGLVLDEAASRLTHTGWGMGTPAYMPPEQWNGQAVPQSDIYALGATFFEMLAGDAPFRASSPSALMIKHMSEQPPRMVSVRPEASEGLQSILDKALAKKPEDRYESCAAFAAALAAVGSPQSAGDGSFLADATVPLFRQSPIPSLPDAGQLKQPDSRKPKSGSSARASERAPTQGVPRRRALALLGGAGALGLGGFAVASILGSGSAPAIRKVNADRAVWLVSPGTEMELVRVPEGIFTMGSSNRFDDERPQDRISLSEYWIGRTHVTVAQFAAFAKATSFRTQAEKDGLSWVHEDGKWSEVAGADWSHPLGKNSTRALLQNHPVVHVSWDDAIAFCTWATSGTRLSIRLPSEAEWEKAARGFDAREYPWGNAKPSATVCNFNGNVGGTTAAGAYSPAADSPYGCTDMAGNAWHWTNSVYRLYPYLATDGRESVADRGPRTARGGGFDSMGETSVRAAARSTYGVAIHYGDLGFRVCMSTLS